MTGITSQVMSGKDAGPVDLVGGQQTISVDICYGYRTFQYGNPQDRGLSCRSADEAHPGGAGAYGTKNMSIAVRVHPAQNAFAANDSGHSAASFGDKVNTWI